MTAIVYNTEWMIQENNYLMHKLLSTSILKYIWGQLLIVKRCHALLQIKTASNFFPHVSTEEQFTKHLNVTSSYEDAKTR